jgi:hypothetical protein
MTLQEPLLALGLHPSAHQYWGLSPPSKTRLTNIPYSLFPIPSKEEKNFGASHIPGYNHITFAHRGYNPGASNLF